MIGKYNNMKKLFIALSIIASAVGNVFSQSMIISGGGDHALALCSKGQIFAWGMNNHGQLCIKGGGPSIVNEPTQVNTGNLTFSMVSAGSGSHSVALSCHKVVYAFGANTYGQCGQPARSPEYITDTPVPIPHGDAPGYTLEGEPGGDYLGGVKYIAASSGASLAILEDGRCVYWGGNEEMVDGKFIKDPTHLPRFIMGPDNKPLENVIHVAGGDNNILLVVGDSPNAKVGTVYSLGNLNGRGGGASAEDYAAAPVEIGDGTGTESSGKYLTNVRTTGLSDTGGMAVDGSTGYVYAWGKNGWWGSCGLQMQYPASEIVYAEKVTSGEYEDISGEPFLTDAIQVIGGNGSATCVTKDGQILYWGHNAGASGGNSGGTIPNSTYKNIDDTKKIGPVFGNYCASGTNPERRVEDAVAIARGDLCGFMVNEKGEFYSWGTTKLPGTSTDAGTLGTKLDKDIKTCFAKIEIDCRPQDLCPEAFMIPHMNKCPGETIELYSGFTPLKGSEKSYYYKWSKDGIVLNTTQPTDDENTRNNEIYNKETLKISEPGLYRVDIYYVGLNVPCENCPDAFAECEVIDMEMPIDTVIPLSCVPDENDRLEPSSADLIKFKAIVNDKFYSSKDDVTFAAFATPTSEDTLKDVNGKNIIINTTGDGGEIEFEVTGDQLDRTLGAEPGKDTLYHVWIEDISSFQTSLNSIAAGKVPKEDPNNGFNFDDNGLLITLYSAATLDSFDIFGVGYSSPFTITVTPIIYKIGTLDNGGSQYIPSTTVVWEGNPQSKTFDGTKETVQTIKCGVKLTANPARGTSYFVGIKIKEANFNGKILGGPISTEKTAKYSTPIIDDQGFGIEIMGAVVGDLSRTQNGTNQTPFYNLKFGKLTDYNCGRIMLSSKLYCPPCNDPKNLEIIASETIKDDVDADYKKVVELCKESDDLVLDIEPLEGKNDPTAKFDIHWYDENPLGSPTAKAIIEDETGNATTLELKTDWATVAGAADIKKDVEKVYYIKVHDHEKPGCVHYDSIKVIAHPAPVDSLDWMEFCEGSLATEPTFEIADMTINWVDEPTNVVSLTGPATGTGTKEYTYKYTVVDNKTGCESVEHTLTISVNKTGKPDVKEQISLLKDPSVKYNLSAAENNVDTDCEIHWYESETATSEMTNKSIPLDNADTIIVWAEQYNTVTKCTSERVKVEIIINDAPVPEVTNESLCLDNEIPSLAEYVKAKEHHELKWYDDPAAAKGTGSETAPSFKATAAGTYKFYVSQKDSVTNAESEKATLTITVHEVATLDLSANKTEYCINETAEELTFKANSDGDFTTANWSKKSDMSDATATLTPKTDEKGDVTYYAQAEYTNKDAQKKYASTVCYGKIQDITITTNMTNAPLSNTNFTVQYLKAEGDKNKSYKPLLDQDNTAVITEAGHTLKWYDSNKNPLSAEPAPEYIDNETGERTVTYWVSQVNTSTGCESELIEVTAFISSFPAPKVKALTFCQGSDELKSSYPLTATINTDGGFSEGSYQLIWYKQDPKANPSAEEFTIIDLHLEDLSYDATTVTEKDFKYWVVQRYNGPGGGQSPATPLLVTIYSKPILKTSKPDPICLGGEVDLKDLYSISNRIDNQQYELEYLSSNGTNPKGSIATVHGEYQCRAWFELSSGEICRSKFEDVFVTVNELEVAIEGDNTTCPGIGVELKAVLKTNNMDANDVPSYSWNVSPTGVTGQMETLNTSSEGLNKKGDKITVDLEVSMGACKGKKPVNAHIVTVEDPGVEGTIKFDEQYNANSGKGTFTLSKDGTVVFDGCNSKVDVLFNVKQTEEKFTYENLETGEKKTGTFSNGEGKFDIKAGLYEVTYTNTCATSFKFDVKDKSLDITGIALNWSVCEGTPLTINIVNFKDRTPFAYDSKKHKIEWQKDGNPLPGYDTEVLYIPSTTPADNGVYSYTVTSSGCVYHEKIAMGGSFKSKPKVKINESLLAKDGIYEAVRTTAKEITIPIIQSVGIDMSKLKDKIVWKENGDTINIGEKLSLSSVDAEHEYRIVIANGETGYNPEFCGTSLDITLKVDALLSIEAILVDANGKQTKDMCLNEEGVGFKIDTTGTGTILHPDKFTFKIVETIDGVKKDIGLAKKDDYLFAEISPNKSAKYDIVYKYEVGNQDSSKASEITVHPAYEVDWDRNVRLCEGETGFIQITKAEPASEIELKWESDECLINGSQNGANVKAVFSGSGLVEKKAMTLIASNGGICADKKYYPEFTIDKAIEGEIIAPEFVCEGHTATLDASPFKATEYVWSSPDQLGEGVTMYGPSINVVSKPGYATYAVEMKRGACTQTADATIEVRYAPRFDRIDSLSFRSVEIVLQSNTGTAPFQYIVDDNYDENINEPIKDSLEYGNHSIKIIDAAGCQIDSSFVTHAPGLEFPIHISPNGDGINDAFSIPVLRDAYPDANIRIFDRWGKKLADYKAGNAELDWDGTYNGVQMPSTDYWYEIEIKEIKKTYTGHFTLIRQ